MQDLLLEIAPHRLRALGVTPQVEELLLGAIQRFADVKLFSVIKRYLSVPLKHVLKTFKGYSC